ncbi:MAG: hypothetical protein ABIX28_16650 [Vicinamibacterales bacterium]
MSVAEMPVAMGIDASTGRPLGGLEAADLRIIGREIADSSQARELRQ